MQEIRAHISQFVAAEAPVTVRQVFYHLVSSQVIEKSEREYSATVVRLLGDMRLSGDIDFSDIADSTRWMRKPRTYDSTGEMLRITAETYRRALWTHADVYVEVWLEKEALAGVVVDVTGPFDVPLMVTRGYPSLSLLHAAAAAFPKDRPTVIYYLGDCDPSGRDIPRNVLTRLTEFAARPDLIDFRLLAVTDEQIEEMNLPTRPTKSQDPRSFGFSGESVEVDAIPPATLRAIVTAALKQHIDDQELERLWNTEEMERATLLQMAADLEDEG